MHFQTRVGLHNVQIQVRSEFYHQFYSVISLKPISDFPIGKRLFIDEVSLSLIKDITCLNRPMSAWGTRRLIVDSVVVQLLAIVFGLVDRQETLTFNLDVEGTSNETKFKLNRNIFKAFHQYLQGDQLILKPEGTEVTSCNIFLIVTNLARRLPSGFSFKQVSIFFDGQC